MFNITIWCHEEKTAMIKALIPPTLEFSYMNDPIQSDVLLVDISEEQYSLQHTMPLLQKIQGNCILVLLAEHSDQFLDVVGIFVYQFVLHHQLQQRIPICFQQIHQYLMTVSTICIHGNREKEFIKVKEIRYVKIEDTIVIIGLKHREVVTQFTSLEKVKGLLGEEMQYANRTTLVNLSFITKIADTIVYLDEFSCTLSRRRKKQLLSCCEQRRRSI